MVGNKIRHKRKQEHLTISQLASMAGISESYISQLERGIVDPSVSVLRKIASVLEVPLSSFFDEEYEKPILVPMSDRVKVQKEGVFLSWISPKDEKIEMIEFKLDKDCSYKPESYKQDLCILVTQGSLQIQMENETIVLYEQDSIFINKEVQFTIKNISNEQTIGMLSRSKGDM